MGWDNAQDGVEVERKGTHTAGQVAEGIALGRMGGPGMGTHLGGGADLSGARTWAVVRT